MTDRDLIAEGREKLANWQRDLRNGEALSAWMFGNLAAVLDELEAARRSLAAIKVADPDLFDPRGGISRGAAYETYGSAGHDLREKYLAAIGVTPEEADDGDVS